MFSPSAPAGDTPGVPLYTPDFAADPHRAYREMRATYGSLAPVSLAPGVPATLVIGYHAALRILNDPEHFPADSRLWEKDIPADCPVRPLLAWRPNALHSAGLEHARYRRANVASLDAVDLHALHATVERTAVGLINSFCAVGHAELIGQYAFPLAFGALNTLVGCPAEIGEQLATGFAAMFEGVAADKGRTMLDRALRELVAIKRAMPGDDLTSRLLAHSAALDDRETVHQIATLYGAGIEPALNLIVNTVLHMLADDRFGGEIAGGSLSTRDALDEVLFSDPPLANFCVSYPRQPIMIEDRWLPAHQPVVISMAACNNDPAIRTGSHVGNRSHLSWGAGPHACPAKSPAYLIAQDAVDQLLDVLPEIRLAIPASELTWRPGPFHRSLASLPVVFPATASFVF